MNTVKEPGAYSTWFLNQYCHHEPNICSSCFHANMQLYVARLWTAGLPV